MPVNVVFSECQNLSFKLHLSNQLECLLSTFFSTYSETLNKEYIERIQQMSYSSLSDNGMLQKFSFLIK